MQDKRQCWAVMITVTLLPGAIKEATHHVPLHVALSTDNNRLADQNAIFGLSAHLTLLRHRMLLNPMLDFTADFSKKHGR